MTRRQLFMALAGCVTVATVKPEAKAPELDEGRWMTRDGAQRLCDECQFPIKTKLHGTLYPRTLSTDLSTARLGQASLVGGRLGGGKSLEQMSAAASGWLGAPKGWMQ